MSGPTARAAAPEAVFPERPGCPFCGGAAGELLLEIDYHDTAEAERELPNVHGSLRACDGCGVAHPSHGYDLARLVELYQKNLSKLDLFHRSFLQELRQLLLREIARGRPRRLSPGSLLDALSLRAFLVPPWSRPLRGRAVLDVGCGYGDFSRIFRALGASVVCSEVVPALVERLRADGFECHLEELERLELGARRFDLVFLRGVLYRTRQPAAALAAARRLLLPGGEIACLDPGAGRDAAAYFLRRQFPQGQFYLLDRARYAAMLRERFGLLMEGARQIYGRPAPLPQQGILGNLREFGSILSGNLLRQRPYVLAYTLREAA